MVTDSRYFLVSITCRAINNTSPTTTTTATQRHEHPPHHHLHQQQNQTMRTANRMMPTIEMTTLTTKMYNKMKKSLSINRNVSVSVSESTYTITYKIQIILMLRINTTNPLFANNQMRTFTERSMQTMDQHIKCNNITTKSKTTRIVTNTYT